MKVTTKEVLAAGTPWDVVDRVQDRSRQMGQARGTPGGAARLTDQQAKEIAQSKGWKVIRKQFSGGIPWGNGASWQVIDAEGKTLASSRTPGGAVSAALQRSRYETNPKSAAWVDLDREAPYHTENHNIGHDRKTQEGPFATNEAFPNTWLPTSATGDIPESQRTPTEFPRKRANEEVLPGVSRRLFHVWAKTHEAETNFDYQRDIASLEEFTHHLYAFLGEARRIGAVHGVEKMKIVKHYLENNKPMRGGDEYSYAEGEEHVRRLDSILNAAHHECCRLTNTEGIEWYNVIDRQMGKRPLEDSLTPEDTAELGVKPHEEWGGMGVRVAPKPYTPQPYKGDPMFRDLWERKRKHELTGMKVCAVDVDVKKFKRKRKPKQQDSFDQSIDQTMQELDAPQPAPIPQSQPIPQRGIEVSPEVEDEAPFSMNPADIGKTIGEWDWETVDEGEGLEGTIFFYRKNIELSEDDYDDRLEFIAFVEPLAVRKKRLMEQAKQQRQYNSPRWRETQQEADGMPTNGYLNDVEVYYKGDLIFHRERSFRPGQELSQREFMSGDAMQRAITDLQQYVRTKLDPLPVGEFYQHVIANPGRGEQKLSKRGIAKHVCQVCRGVPAEGFEGSCPGCGTTPKQRRTEKQVVQPKEKSAMKITAAEVIPFPGRRGPKRVEAPGMEDAFQTDFPNLDLPLQGESGDDLESLMYMYDSIAGSLGDVRNSMIRAMQKVGDPKQKAEVGRLLRNLDRAIQVLGQ